MALKKKSARSYHTSHAGGETSVRPGGRKGQGQHTPNRAAQNARWEQSKRLPKQINGGAA